MVSTHGQWALNSGRIESSMVFHAGQSAKEVLVDDVSCRSDHLIFGGQSRIAVATAYDMIGSSGHSRKRAFLHLYRAGLPSCGIRRNSHDRFAECCASAVGIRARLVGIALVDTVIPAEPQAQTPSTRSRSRCCGGGQIRGGPIILGPRQTMRPSDADDFGS